MKPGLAKPQRARERAGRAVVSLPPGEAGALVLAGAYAIVLLRKAERRRRQGEGTVKP